MPFRYRLQKMLDFRIRKKEEQLIVVQKAQQAVYEAEMRIKANDEEIALTIKNKRTADYRMMEYFDKYLHHLWDKGEQLLREKEELEEILRKEVEKLTKCEQDVKVLEDHKEKKREEYKEEERKEELKMYSEIGVQRHYIRNKEGAETQTQQEQQ